MQVNKKLVIGSFIQHHKFLKNQPMQISNHISDIYWVKEKIKPILIYFSKVKKMRTNIYLLVQFMKSIPCNKLITLNLLCEESWKSKSVP